MAPFKHSNNSCFHIQSNLIIALIPLIIWSSFVFGAKTLTLVFFSISSAFITEFIFYAISKNLKKFNPLRPIINGILSCLILPVSAPVWIAALSGLISTIIVLISYLRPFSCNIINPISASGIILYGFFGKIAHSFTAPFDRFSAFDFNSIAENPVTTILQSFQNKTDSITDITLLNIFLGRNSGTMGEVSILLILVSFGYLIYKKYISWHIPVTFTVTVFLFSFFLPTGNCEAIYSAAAETLSGGVVFMAVFIASMPNASPITQSGKVIFGILCGVITFALRRFTSIPDGSIFAVGLSSIFSQIIDNFTGNNYFSYLTDRKKDSEPKKTDLEALLK